MPYSMKMDEGILKVELFGTLTNPDLLAGAADAAAIESTHAIIPHRIIDLRPVERLEIDFAGVYALAEFRRRMTLQNRIKSALIAPQTAHYGFARMFQTLNDHPQIVIAIFGDDESAMEWLGRPDMSRPEVLWSPRQD